LENGRPAAVWLNVDPATLPWLAQNAAYWRSWETRPVDELEADAALCEAPWDTYKTGGTSSENHTRSERGA
ncbi:hypothetical protein, partial [uncultured Halomonas sp.]|uniref:hypothetical protein n=1 Tax=uncultured Halomonas sp. TaxID=173971 RepID=UPI00262D02FA